MKALIPHSTTLSHPGKMMRRQDTKPDLALTAHRADILGSQRHMVLLRVTESHRAERDSSAAILIHPLILIP